MTDIRKIAVTTGGGDCPGLNAVIRAVTRTAINDYGWEVVGIEDGFNGLLEDEIRLMDLNPDSVRGILPRGGTILGSTNRGHPFEFPVKQSDGSVVIEDRSDLLVKRMSQHGIDALVVIGGDGTQAIGQRLREKGLRIVGVPKTIDNDLNSTDYTFGFDTACNIVAESLDRLHTTAHSHDRAMFLEVMGRHAGWIALHGGLAGGAHAILLPEIPYDVNNIVNKIRERQARGRTYSIVVVAEGARPVGGEMAKRLSPFTGKVQLGGAAERVAVEVANKIDLEVRVTSLGHIQRGGTPSHFDRVLGTRYGYHAVKLLGEGKYGRLCVLRGLSIEDVDIKEAIGAEKLVTPDGQIIRAARSIGVSFG